MTKSAAPKYIVFYADDDPDDLELVQEAFSRYSNRVEVVTARDGSAALNYFSSLKADQPAPCLIILDVNMPMMNGKEVLKKLRDMPRFESIPVVLFTTSSLPQDQHFAEKYGAGFVTKPLDYTQMELITELFIDHCTDEIKKSIRRRFL